MIAHKKLIKARPIDNKTNFLIFYLKRNKKDCLAIGFILVLCLVFFAKLFIPAPKIFSTAEIGINDIWYFNFPLKHFVSETLKDNSLPFWNPYRAGGFPELAESQVGVYNAYNLISLKFLSSITAFNLGYIVIFFISGLGTYLFCRKLGFSSLGSCFAAIIYAFSGFYVTHISHFLLIQTACYFPLLAYFADAIYKDSKHLLVKVLAFALILSQQMFSGNPQTVFISLLGIAILIGFSYLADRNIKITRTVLLLSAVVLGVVLSAAQILPTWELKNLSARGGGLSTNELLFYKYPAKHLITFLIPFFFGNPQLGTYPHFNNFNGSIFWENTGYIGLLSLVTSVIGLIVSIRRPKYRGFLLLMLLSFLLMLGGDSPLYFLLTLPPFSFFRFPSRFLLLFLFGLVIMSALGLEVIWKRTRKHAYFKYLPIFIVIVTIFDIFHIWYNYHPVLPYSDFEQIPQTVQFLTANTSGRTYTYLQNARAMDEFLTAGSKNIDKYIDLRNELGPNINVFFHIPTTDTYSSLIPKRMAVFNSVLSSTYKIATETAMLNEKMMRRLAIRNTTRILSPIPLTNTSLSFDTDILLPHWQKKLYIYKNNEALPRFYLVNKWRQVETFEDAEKMLSASDFDIHSEILVEHKMPDELKTATTHGKITIIKDNLTDIELDVTAPDATVLVLNNTYYPGWQATDNGKSTEIFPTNIINQGIFLYSGIHKIHISFFPKIAIIGLVITIVSYAFCLILLVGYGFRLYRTMRLRINS